MRTVVGVRARRNHRARHARRRDSRTTCGEVFAMHMRWLLAGCLAAVAGAATAAGAASGGYGLWLASRLSQPQYMTLETASGPFCAGEIALGKPLRCPDVPQPPTMVKVVWGAPSSWTAAAARGKALPAGWKTVSGPTRQETLASGWLSPPWWFRSGDAMLFTINRMHELSVTYQCNRPGHECVSYPPVTSFGRPQGVTPLSP